MSRGKLAKRRDDLLEHPRLKQREIKEWRDKLYEEQGMVCGVCGLPIEEETGKVLDHCHASGHIRGTLHRGCNALLGKIEGNYKRLGVSVDSLVRISLPVYNWVSGNYETNPYHPSHRTAEEKRLSRNARAREKRVAKRAARRKKDRGSL